MSLLAFGLARSIVHTPRAQKLNPIIASKAAMLKNRTGKYDPPIGLSLGMVGRLLSIGPKR